MDGVRDIASEQLKRRDGSLDAGNDVRARMQFLAAQNHSIVAQTQFADAKAAALMTLVGVTAMRGPVDLTLSPSSPLSIVVIGFVALSMIACLWSIMPRYPRTSVAGLILARDKYSWVSIGSPGWSVKDHDTFAREADLLEMIGSLARSNVAGSQVLFRKFRAMKVAFMSAIGALVAMGAALMQ